MKVSSRTTRPETMRKISLSSRRTGARAAFNFLSRASISLIVFPFHRHDLVAFDPQRLGDRAHHHAVFRDLALPELERHGVVEPACDGLARIEQGTRARLAQQKRREQVD